MTIKSGSRREMRHPIARTVLRGLVRPFDHLQNRWRLLLGAPRPDGLKPGKLRFRRADSSTIRTCTVRLAHEAGATVVLLDARSHVALGPGVELADVQIVGTDPAIAGTYMESAVVVRAGSGPDGVVVELARTTSVVTPVVERLP